MISSELAPAAPGPVQPRHTGRSAGPAPERPFEDFVEGAPSQAAGAGEAAEAAGEAVAAAEGGAIPELEAAAADLLALLEAAAASEAAPADLLALVDVAAAPEAAPTPAPEVPAVPAQPLALAAPAMAEAGDAPPPPAPTAPAAPVVAGPAAPAPAAPASPAAVAAEPETAGMEPAEAEAEAAPEPLPRLPAAAAGTAAPGGAEPRSAGPASFELALQPGVAAPAWRLAALAADPALAAREPAPAPAPRDVAGQITLAIAQSTQPQLEIRLDPPELGRVQIRLNPTEHGLQATVFAERPETQDFLRRHAETLRGDLVEAGYGEVSIDFAAGGEAAPRDATEPERRLGAAYEPIAAPAAAREPPRRAAAAGLDIRL